LAVLSAGKAGLGGVFGCPCWLGKRSAAIVKVFFCVKQCAINGIVRAAKNTPL
jgi:hypothetical protein